MKRESGRGPPVAEWVDVEAGSPALRLFRNSGGHLRGSTAGGAGQFLVREGPKILFMIVYLSLLVAYLVGFVWAGVKRHKLAWHDLASRTQVIYLLPSA
jgi:hypothetical protein